MGKMSCDRSGCKNNSCGKKIVYPWGDKCICDSCYFELREYVKTSRDSADVGEKICEFMDGAISSVETDIENEFQKWIKLPEDNNN